MDLGKPHRILVCTCDRTMPDYGDHVARGCLGAEVDSGNQLCGAGLDRVRAMMQDAGTVTIGCTQQAPLFRRSPRSSASRRARLREHPRDRGLAATPAADAGPKMAALIAMAAEPPAAAPEAVTLTSEGVALIYGRDETAIEAGRRLADTLDITVLLSRPQDVAPHRVWDFPVLQGTIRNASGHLGAFELVVDDFAAPAPSSRVALRFGPPRDGAVSRADILLDLSGGAPLFPAHELRDGYVRADPGDRAAVAEALWKAADLVGEFDKPRFIDFSAELCAHSRSRITGCTRCLELCPTGAIAPAGDHVVIDAWICAGCGSCAAACPTGAAAYALSASAEALLRRVRTLIRTYLGAGGVRPVVLFHDAGHGEPLIDALARFGAGLPANVLPVARQRDHASSASRPGPRLRLGRAAVRALGARPADSTTPRASRRTSPPRTS